MSHVNPIGFSVCGMQNTPGPEFWCHSKMSPTFKRGDLSGHGMVTSKSSNISLYGVRTNFILASSVAEFRDQKNYWTMALGPSVISVYWLWIFNNTHVQLLWMNLSMFSPMGRYGEVVDVCIWWLKWDMDEFYNLSIHWMWPIQLVVTRLIPFAVNTRNTNPLIGFFML